MLAREPEMHGSDQVDTVQLLRTGDGSVEVVASGANGPYFRRKFQDAETKEVRLYLKDGDDRAFSEGRGGPGVKVRLVGGGGNDVLDDSAGGHTRFYDSSGENQVIEGPGTRKNDRPYSTPLDGKEAPLRDWGASSRILPWFRAGSGYGVVLGLSLEQIDYGFRKHPYSHRHALRVGYSTERQAAGVHYDYESLRTDSRAASRCTRGPRRWRSSTSTASGTRPSAASAPSTTWIRGASCWRPPTGWTWRRSTSCWGRW